MELTISLTANDNYRIEEDGRAIAEIPAPESGKYLHLGVAWSPESTLVFVDGASVPVERPTSR